MKKIRVLFSAMAALLAFVGVYAQSAVVNYRLYIPNYPNRLSSDGVFCQISLPGINGCLSAPPTRCTIPVTYLVNEDDATYHVVVSKRDLDQPSAPCEAAFKP